LPSRDIDVVLIQARQTFEAVVQQIRDQLTRGVLKPRNKLSSERAFADHLLNGTCRGSGRGDQPAPAGARLRWGLLVADASGMPDIIDGYMALPSMMIGEREAAFILMKSQVPQATASCKEFLAL
jgi:choline dehydrogenase-like flavoprotein